MYTDAVDGFDEEVRDGLVATFLDHALGEEFVMQNVKRMDVSVISKGDQKQMLSGKKMVDLIETLRR